MRKLIGTIVLVAGVGTLGYVGTTQHAARIQTAIGDDARAIATAAPLGIQTAVSGRDLVVTGMVTDATDLAVLQAAFEGIDGLRSLDIKNVETLPIADPFQIEVSRIADGSFSAEGVLPSDAVRIALNDAAFDDVPLASGMPDADWADALQGGLTALSQLNEGQMTLANRNLTLEGATRVPADYEKMLLAIETLPEGYTFENQVTVLDDGEPLRLSMTLLDGAVDATGKFPADMQPEEVSERFDIRDQFEIEQSVLTAADPDWLNAARAGMEALAGLIEADLVVEEGALTITGVGSPDGIAKAQSLLGGLPDSYSVTTELGVWGADFELRLDMSWDGNSAVAEGTYPLDFTPRSPEGATVTDTGRVLFLPDDIGDFTANANAGVEALALLDSGTLSATQTSIVLTGEAASPRISAALDEALVGAADGTEVSRAVTFLDDGSPAAWSLNYDVESGARIEGRLPSGLDTETIGEALGVTQLTGTPGTALEDDDIGTSLESFEILSGYIREIEQLSYSIDSTGSALDLVVSSGGNVDLIAAELAENLPQDVSFSLSVMDPPPEDGTKRTNALSGVDEVYTNGYWLPSIGPVAGTTECDAHTLNVFERGQIGFLSSSARFDATSTSTVNALAAVALACVDAGLTLEVGGHTDATGSVLANEVLSANRANSVRTALIERGVPAENITAVGYGQSEPIADNETAEGRAANRRTDIKWFTAGAVGNQ
ncbi:OmpA family protein [Octadecabacter ascidiaceicola]|uniref:Outer membrane porin F n=1 Tax=Octadecabacter ascidiaceicola TaxID=1655543 RepID=A0A238KKM2_9RHOB|nr:OmpA family protein [Octadecabacter ascidiaceicola]SMX43187.1 Outer membrane porin F precursor [Octadecabacter ascidiaceicola]